MVRGSTEKDLLEISKPNTQVWETATVFIGNQPGGYKVSKVHFMTFFITGRGLS